MDCKTELINYADTGYFSKTILDYLKEDPRLKPFYRYSPEHPPFEEIIEKRKLFHTDRTLLVSELNARYSGMKMDNKVSENIRLLSDENTFTICTAHQPNLFTGYLYFVYKILHAIRLSEYLKEKFPQYHFVPVYYMGSEDNDLEELGTVHAGDNTYRWKTTQKGAVGRMKTQGLDTLIEEVTKTLGTNEYAQKIKSLLQEAYLHHVDIQTATLYLVNELFGHYGLVTIIADTPGFKRSILPVMHEDLFQENSYKIVSETISQLFKDYPAQASPREINLFYMQDQVRERIVKEGEQWRVLNTDLKFNKTELENELQVHPERFSPNVILRGILQESILPNLVFIGGGGELAYWMELKSLFKHYRTPFPMLMLRNSVLWVDNKSMQRLKKVGLTPKNLFQETETLINDFVERNTQQQLVLRKEYKQIEDLYAGLIKKATEIDITLKDSVQAAKKKSLVAIGKLEHKFLKAEKKKFSWQTELISNVKSVLFPHHHLQERWENLVLFYAVYGPAFIDTIYKNLDPLNKQFTIVIDC